MNGITGWMLGGLLAAAAVAAVWFDLRERRIPNALTVGALLAALLVRVPEGLGAVGSGLLGAAIGFILFLPLFLVGGLGGGDVKLMTAFGAFLGPERLFPALLVTALVGGVLALLEVVRRRAFVRTLRNIGLLPRTVAGRVLRRGAPETGPHFLTLASPEAITVPYGVAISAGALFAWFI